MSDYSYIYHNIELKPCKRASSTDLFLTFVNNDMATYIIPALRNPHDKTVRFDIQFFDGLLLAVRKYLMSGLITKRDGFRHLCISLLEFPSSPYVSRGSLRVVTFWCLV